MKSIKIIFFVFIIVNKLYSQDSLNLYFRNLTIIPKDTCNAVYQNNDSLHFTEIIFKIDSVKFFYIRRDKINDGLILESGLLCLYQGEVISFLLRDGIWLTEGNDEKLLFRSKMEEGYPVETPVMLDQIWYDEKTNKSQKQKGKN